MIDEELYQQAADELNSDARRPHLWARACALASDDHDEARFLYTNLRVEELLAARKASPADASRPPAGNDGHVDDVELALAPLDGETAREAADDRADGPPERTAFDALPDRTDGSALGQRTRDMPDLDEPAGPPFDDVTFTGAPDPHDRMLNDSPDESLDPALDGGGMEMPAGADAPDLRRSPAREPHGAPAFEEPADPPFDATLIDEPHWLDEELVLDHPAPGGAADTGEAHGTPLDRFGEHHDADRPTEQWGYAADAPPPAPAPAGGGAPVAPVAPGGRAASGLEHRERAHEPTSPSSDRGPATGTRNPRPPLPAPSGRNGDRGPVVDLDGTGPVWALYEHGDGQLKAVRRGVSWGAMLLTLPWLLWRGLPGTALVYALLWAISLGGLLVSALAWSDAGASASPILRVICAGFALVALTGLVIVPFLQANRWRETAWQRRGHALRGEVRTGSASQAKRRVLDA